MRLILASSSPRRAELLTAAGFEFEVQAVEVDERLQPGEPARDYVARLAGWKSAAASTNERDVLVLGADTTVVVGSDSLGKPSSDSEAREMLRRLSGTAHDVLTGVSIRHGDRLACEVVSTRVWFTRLDAEEIEWYLKSGEHQGKAGAYGIQGAASRFIDRIDGSYSNVVGLPVATVYRLLRGFGFNH